MHLAGLTNVVMLISGDLIEVLNCIRYVCTTKQIYTVNNPKQRSKGKAKNLLVERMWLTSRLLSRRTIAERTEKTGSFIAS
jgi:hypothetical protein